MKAGDRGDEVAAWQRVLHGLGLGAVCGAVDGIFGPKTEAATRAAEELLNFPPTGTVYGILADSADRRLKSGKGKAEGEKRKAESGSLPALVRVARSQLGVIEQKGNRGPDVARYFAATSYPDGEKHGEPWCAAFVAWCVREAMADLLLTEATRPKSAAVSSWPTHALRQGWLVFGGHDRMYKPRAGDVVIYAFSHMGVVESFDGKSVTAIEGNTNEGGEREGIAVMRKVRSLGACKCFIRLPGGGGR